ncbi:T9SS type A sorting domain-containing protein [Flavobacterium sp.]|uniref:T9SS type A sorting domain-containing protein n=1 Tax=Flavobacterium sp. TaxID=239 RepID=UPI0028BEC98E|nr:T9SS type A sorting domain-containing protein [Flavobacterium sp.]
MKRKLLLISTFVSCIATAQVLQTENFNGLTVGNVGTDITGVTAGQGSWFTFSTNGTAPTTSTNAGNANFQIVASGNNSSNGLLFQGPNGDKGSRFMWKDGLPAAWAGRTTGNNIIEVEYDFFTGSTTTSTAQSGIRLFGMDGTNSRVLCGYVYNSNTRLLQGVAYLNNGGVFNTFLITLQTGGLILNADTWYRIGFGYDTTTGEPYWKFNSSPSVSVNPVNFAGPFQPEEVDFVMGVPNTNTVSSNITFDNYVSRASNTDTLLGTNDFNSLSASKFTVYPNPVNNIVNISNTANIQIEKVSLTDVNGRIVKTVNAGSLTDVQVNVSELNSGVYFMNIETNEGSATKKIVKQ